jgi:hypothetical protein
MTENPADPADPAGLLRRLPPPTLDLDEDDGAELRRAELRRSILEIAGIDHAREISLVRAVVARIRDGGSR